jgi:hypothetical protein
MVELSPAAQAVLAAMHRSYDHEPTRRAIAAEVLRAAADGVKHHWDGMECVDYLCSIAAELEAQP